MGPTARHGLEPMGSAAASTAKRSGWGMGPATAKRSGWGMGPAIWTSVKRLNAYTINLKEANGNSRRAPT